jgi:RHS repeat-associated protein
MSCTGATVSPLYFAGKERDAETGLDYFGARYNASNLGRFVTPDWSAKVEPVPYAELGSPQSLNLYVYALDSPVTHADMGGHAATCEIGDGSHCNITLNQITQDVNFYNKGGRVVSTVRVTTDITTVTNSKTGAVVSVGASATAANVSGLKFSASQLEVIGSTVGAVQQAGASMSLGPDPTQLLTAITARESTLGVLAPVNPLQLSCSSGACANGDRAHNIQSALNVLQTLGGPSDYNPAATYGRYNGVPDAVQRAENVQSFMRIYNSMTQSVWSWSPTVPSPPLPPGLQ